MIEPSKDWTLCQIVRLFAVSSTSACFAALAVLSVINGLAVPLWVIAGFWSVWRWQFG
jgi:hypothetical protein